MTNAWTLIVASVTDAFKDVLGIFSFGRAVGGGSVSFPIKFVDCIDTSCLECSSGIQSVRLCS